MLSLKLGNCLDILKDIPDSSVDSMVTDPPYGLNFMGKKWDYDVPSVDIWKECLRVLKPGGHLLAFGGTRTYHRLVVAIEDAGFEIRDQIQWLYGQGFPKSQNISIAIDKQLGAMGHRGKAFQTAGAGDREDIQGTTGAEAFEKHEGITPEAQKWSGWGTALKPANEPICLARKPLSEKTIAKNVLRWGTGGLNIDSARIETTDNLNGGAYANQGDRDPSSFLLGSTGKKFVQPIGRFPANVIFDEEVAQVLDEQSGANNSRFFYVAKASKSDRGEGNAHPTVKPVKLMEYLIKLITPEGGVILDPFLGSGTTGVAAVKLNYPFIGIELNSDYLDVAKRRIHGVSKHDTESNNV